MKLLILGFLIVAAAFTPWVMRKPPSASSAPEIHESPKTFHRVEIISEDGKSKWVEVELMPTSIPEPGVLTMLLMPALALLVRRRC